MSNTANTRTKQKRSKLTLDRLLSIKKHIMDSFNLLSKHDKASSQIGRNNTVPKGKGNAIYRKMPKNDGQTRDTTNIPQVTTASAQNSDQTRNLTSYLGDLPLTASMHSTLQRIQTWPHDDYSAPVFEDQYSANTANHFHPQTLQRHSPQLMDQYHNGSTVEQSSSAQNNYNIRSVKNQEIQTDINEIFDVNADIIRYLSQFNDKIAFNMYTPSPPRTSGEFCPYYYEHGYYLYSNSNNHMDHLPNKRVHRRHEEVISLAKREHYVHDITCRPQYDYPPMAGREPQRQGFGVLNEPQWHKGFENIKLVPVTSDITSTNSNNLLAPPRVDTRVSSEDSGSILSSETDSDFMFYPCSSLTQTFQRMTLIDSRNTTFLSPPLDLPENINTNFSWRSDFYGSSLDEVTLQFFLDDDALSDDVFVDDQELPYAINTTQDPKEYFQHDTAEQTAGWHNQMYDMSHQSDLECILNEGEDIGFTESYGDNCYAYRYADIDEVLNNNKYSPEENDQSTPEINQTNGNEHNAVATGDEYIPSSSDPDVKFSSEDPHLELNDEFSNVFDSLRRNSTQTKARKMWRQRRAKSKKNSAEASTSDKNKDRLQTSLGEPTIFTFDHISMHNHSHLNPPVKPLRSILKKTEFKSPNGQEPELQSNQTEDAYNSAGIKMGVPPGIFMFDVNFRSHPNSPCAYASMQTRVSTGVSISNADEMAESCIECILHKQPQNTSGFIGVAPTNAAGNKVTISTNESDTNLNDDNKEDTPSSDNAVPPSDNEEKDTSPPNENTNDQFHLILSSDPDGSRKIIAVRKNSLEAYEWTRSLQRRHRRLARKANSNHNGFKNKDGCLLPLHQSVETSVASI